LAEVVRDINKFSNNVMAEQVFLTLGLHGDLLQNYDPQKRLGGYYVTHVPIHTFIRRFSLGTAPAQAL
jgi:D-alanyl-D-alanine carboxypeptidase/D-alanyl-D-alanine-endopeptidase (penicillin-binding protein 4)